MGAPAAAKPAPLFVELDRTVVQTDLFWEAVVQCVQQRPLAVLLLPIWALRGRRFLSRRLADWVSLDAGALPYREAVVRVVAKAHADGAQIVFLTAQDPRLAQAVTHQLNRDSTVLVLDTSGPQEPLAAIRRYLDAGEFDYVGDARHDAPVWREARTAYTIGPVKPDPHDPGRLSTVESVAPNPSGLRALIKALRIHHWVKNLLLFLPFLMAHEIGRLDTWLTLSAAFISFSLLASSVYITNDLLDLSADRRHPSKRHRPFAAGAVEIPVGIGFAGGLLIASFVIAGLLVSVPFAAMLALYVLLTTAYSFYFKRVPILDVLVLAGLYTHRVLAGGVASATTVSPWLLSFATYFFLSLAMLKRYTELRQFEERDTDPARLNRGYIGGDIRMLRSLGAASGYLSVLVLGLYLHSDKVMLLYSRPGALWLLTPLLLYWVTRIWFLAHRGKVDDDPIVFAARDWPSYLVGALAVVIIAFGAL
ncbi:MAG: UbiA family prenyltransferase [Gemmatimonadales bacterium]|nr:UbiA family prenyltransferase [Gemmatimonadales bacterium]NIN10515.1 UbiA family prenyltransferase [Gemmatimonadales bacterium]NIN49302.1 UbiA family prenyltransferase [Gemmatimonadales bacterium]NIP06766.1 UbiA family prenyltransferase [Gemmatimonadales bacterium]NIR02792.1 UbiA family prenyltransferase [Gemmatimonadales bacterium]